MHSTLTETETKATLNICYVKTASCLTVVANDRVFFVEDRDGSLTQALADYSQQGGKGEYLTSDFDLQRLENCLKVSRYSDLAVHGEKLFHVSAQGLVEVEIEVALRIIDLKEKDLPYEPLLKFWVKFCQSQLAQGISTTERSQLLKMVGTPVFPLTWDGNLMGYFRSHPHRMPEVLSTDGTGLSFRSFAPNPDTDLDDQLDIAGKQFLNPNGLSLYSIGDIKGFCMDQGGIYEVEVNPLFLLRFSPSNRDTAMIKTSSATGVRSLGLQSSIENQGFVSIPVAQCEAGLSVRNPVSDEAAAAYLLELALSDKKVLANLSSATTANNLLVTSC